MKYTKKLIIDYIEGNDIGDYDIDQLENDIEFMKEVIIVSSDKNMYKHCSNELKNNHQFVKFLIEFFKTDLNFICSVADNYLENNNDEVNDLENDNNVENNFELRILMTKLTKDAGDEVRMNYAKYANMLYLNITDVILSTIKRNLSKEEAALYGKAFYFVEQFYSSSKIIMNYCTTRYLEEIFHDDESPVDLEEVLHNKFASYEAFKNYGEKKFLTELIRKYDYFLANYITLNPEHFSYFDESLNRIKKNWDNYKNMEEENKYVGIIEAVRDYVEHTKNCPFSEIEILYYLARQFNIVDMIDKYTLDGNSKHVFHFIDNELKMDSKNFDLHASKHYLQIKKIFIEALNIKTKITTNQIKPDTKNVNLKNTAFGKVLEFKNRNTNNNN